MTNPIAIEELAPNGGAHLDKVLCSQEIADNLDKMLRNQARGVAHSMERFKSLIDEAKRRCIYPMLGFKSWTTYIADVIGVEMKALPVDDRRQIVALLSGEGMSNRAIADVVGVNEITVRRDMDHVRHDVAPDRIPVGATDVAGVIDELLEGIKNDKVTGRDGKTYPNPAPTPPPPPSQPRRRPIVDDFRNLSLKALAMVKVVTKLAADDRLSRQAGLTGYRNDLIRLRSALDDLIERTPGGSDDPR